MTNVNWLKFIIVGIPVSANSTLDLNYFYD